MDIAIVSTLLLLNIPLYGVYFRFWFDDTEELKQALDDEAEYRIRRIYSRLGLYARFNMATITSHMVQLSMFLATCVVTIIGEFVLVRYALDVLLK